VAQQLGFAPVVNPFRSVLQQRLRHRRVRLHGLQRWQSRIRFNRGHRLHCGRGTAVDVVADRLLLRCAAKLLAHTANPSRRLAVRLVLLVCEGGRLAREKTMIRRQLLHQVPHTPTYPRGIALAVVDHGAGVCNARFSATQAAAVKLTVVRTERAGAPVHNTNYVAHCG